MARKVKKETILKPNFWQTFGKFYTELSGRYWQFKILKFLKFTETSALYDLLFTKIFSFTDEFEI